MLVVAVVVGRARPPNLLALKLDFPYAGLALAADVIRNLNKLQNVLLLAVSVSGACQG